MVRTVALVLMVGLGSACGDDSGSDGGPMVGGDGDGTPLAGMGGDGDGDGDGATDRFGTDANRNTVTADTICARLATIQCAAQELCCDAPDMGFDACVSSAEGACSGALGLGAVAGDPAVGFDAAAASAAFATFEMRAKQCDAAAPAWALSPEGFRGAFTGTVAAGGDCEPSMGLESDLSEIAVALASCTDPGNQACLPTESAGWSCASRSAADGPCFTELNCADGLYCDGAATTSGTCKAQKAVGEACDTPTECSSTLCANSGTCAAAGDVQAAYCL